MAPLLPATNVVRLESDERYKGVDPGREPKIPVGGIGVPMGSSDRVELGFCSPDPEREYVLIKPSGCPLGMMRAGTSQGGKLEFINRTDFAAGCQLNGRCLQTGLQTAS